MTNACRHSRSVLALTLIGLAGVGCGGDDPSGPGGSVAELSISPASALLDAIDATKTFTVEARGGSGESVSADGVEWSSVDPGIVAVSGNGVATARAPGLTRIVAALRGAADTATVQVVPVADGIVIEPALDTIPADGGTTQLSAEAVDANGHPVDDVQVTWTSRDTTVATVDAAGAVTARREWKVHVVASVPGARDSALIVSNDPNANAAPEAEIRRPEDGAGFGAQDVIRFSGRGEDHEEGPLTGGSLVWTSDRDGQLGTGTDVSTSLTIGAHEIVLTASDGQGATGADTIEVVVEPPNLRVLSMELSTRGVLNSSAFGARPVIANLGKTNAGPFDWRLEIDGSLEASGRSQGVAGEDTVVLAGLDNLGPVAAGPHEVRLVLDAAGEVNEGDESDNEGTEHLESYAAGFDVELRFVTQVSDAQRDVFEQAARRWSELVTADLPDVTLTLDEDQCLDGVQNQEVDVEDLVIFVRVDSIDGRGGVLAQAGPCFARTDGADPPSLLTVIAGGMEFDEADFGSSQLETIILHEMGHVLGVGSLWSLQGLLKRGGGTDPVFTGAGGTEAFLSAGGDAYSGELVPVENTGSEGTRDSHWRESVFDDELMTGFISSGENPLSAVTVRSLGDQFYAVDPSRADGYQLPLGGASGRVRGRIDLGDDLLRAPLFGVDPDGRVRRLDRRRLRPPAPERPR